MQTVYKYELKVTGKQAISLPKKRACLSVQVQNNLIQSWWNVDLHSCKEDVYIYCIGTGWGIPEGRLLSHIGTVQLDGLVWHFFEDIITDNLNL